MLRKLAIRFSRRTCAARLRVGVRANLTEGRMSRHRARRAFTLMEVLVVVGILAVLATLTVPLVSRLRESARRAEDLSHLRQLAAATFLYSSENDGALPPGRMGGYANGDDYSWISYANCWKPLLDRAPALASMNTCASVRTGHQGVENFGQPGIDPEYPDDTRVGWFYWGGRDDLTDGSGVVKYRSPRHVQI